MPSRGAENGTNASRTDCRIADLVLQNLMLSNDDVIRSMTISDVGRYLLHVDRSGGAAACWPWMRYRRPSGYGMLMITGRRKRAVRASRVAYYLANDALPTGLEICHSCDRPECCNPAHLFAGSHLDNMRDAQRKGRMRKPPILVGARNPRATLTEDMVRTMRAELAAGLSIAEIAAKHGLNYSPVVYACTWRTWKHVL